jgi:DNA methylase
VTAAVIRGDARHLPLPDGSVDLIVTSPPYFGLRSYTDGGEHYGGQIGSEATPAEFLAALVDCTREWVRVLKPSGSLFVNLGDKYSGYFGPNWKHDRNPGGGERIPRGYRDDLPTSAPTVWGIPNKSLMGLPWRYALACTDQLGLILRAEIVWCLSGGARVYARTPTGDRPVMLRDLARSYQPENVQLWNGERWTQVLGWNRSPGRDGALELELRTGERIGCTPGHRWPTQRGTIRADEISVGDVIRTIWLPEPDELRHHAGLPDDDIGWLIGLYLAEGSRSGKMLQFAGHAAEDLRHARLARIARAYDGNASLYQTSENGVTCNLSGSILIGIVDRYIGTGKTAHSKRLRRATWQRSNAFLGALMVGYLEGDGHYDAKNDRWRLGFTANDELAADLRTLAARLGAKISLRRAMHTMHGRKFPGWRGEWRWSTSEHWNAKQSGEVVAIRSSRAREFYDIGVADAPHLFALASGVLTHNSKPNGLPESVTDRVRRAHEQVFHFTRQPRYYAAVDEIREPHAGEFLSSGARNARYRHPGGMLPGKVAGLRSGKENQAEPTDSRSWAQPAIPLNPLGKLPGSVWTIPSAPLVVPARLGVDHFAAFPPALVRPVILGWSPPGICVACGEGRRPVTIRAIPDFGPRVDGRMAGRSGNGRPRQGNGPTGNGLNVQPTTITGYVCACPQPTALTRPAIVLDPFGGTGTTALVATVHGRHGITVDLSADYCRLARWRVHDPGERARALDVPKPPPVPEWQGALFDADGSVT